MKVLLIFTFFLISGPVSCFDVIGYSGGSVMIYCTIPKNTGHNGYFCKESGRECVYLNADKSSNTWNHKGRVSVLEIPEFLTVIYKDLSLEDTGLYQCGETGSWNHTVNVTIKTDECCSGQKTVIGHPRETGTLNCSYPEEFKEKAKIFYKQNLNEFTPIISTSDSQKYTSSVSETLKERFSISDDKKSISVRIRDVREDDGGVYYCAVGDDGGASNYEILFTKIHLQIKGPVGCSDVIGYAGGSVMIYCPIPKNRGYNGYFCKEPGHHCVYLNPDESQNTWNHKGRVSVAETTRFLKVTYRDLSLQDTGSYQCGETRVWSYTVNLKVKTDLCCSGPKTVIGYTGQSIIINCSYPEEIKEKNKIFYKQDFNEFTPFISTSDSQKYTSSIYETLKKRSSISEDRRSRVVSVRISDVIKDDEGDYYCGVSGDGGAANYEIFTKIHLKIKGSTSILPPSTSPPPATTPGSTVIIPLSIVVALLLIGGAALAFFILILKKRQGSTPSARTDQSGSKEVPAVVSNDEETGLITPTPPKDQDLTYSTATPPKDQDLTYSTATPPKDQDLTYSSVSYHKNPDSPTDASVTVNKEEPETEYATVKHPTALE